MDGEQRIEVVEFFVELFVDSFALFEEWVPGQQL
jgi:hypothetical protein